MSDFNMPLMSFIKILMINVEDLCFQGILDIILTTYTETQGYHTHLLQQDFTEDACFMKIMGKY